MHNNIEFNANAMHDESEDLENTVASIHLNESDLKELDDEFTFDEGDEEGENPCGDGSSGSSGVERNGERKKSLGKNSTLVKRFDMLQSNNCSGDDLLVSGIFLQNLNVNFTGPLSIKDLRYNFYFYFSKE